MVFFFLRKRGKIAFGVLELKMNWDVYILIKCIFLLLNPGPYRCCRRPPAAVCRAALILPLGKDAKEDLSLTSRGIILDSHDQTNKDFLWLTQFTFLNLLFLVSMALLTLSNLCDI